MYTTVVGCPVGHTMGYLMLCPMVWYAVVHHGIPHGKIVPRGILHGVFHGRHMSHEVPQGIDPMGYPMGCHDPMGYNYSMGYHSQGCASWDIPWEPNGTSHGIYHGMSHGWSHEAYCLWKIRWDKTIQASSHFRYCGYPMRYLMGCPMGCPMGIPRGVSWYDSLDMPWNVSMG